MESVEVIATASMTPAFQATYVVTDADATVRHSSPRARLEAVDLLRGLLMILMVIDHTRIYFSNVRVNPTDPSLSWPALFATRWITHLCAPGFIALAGASVYLQRQRGKCAKQTKHLLITRGLWLLFLDLTLISFGWSFTLKAPFMNVISAIGLSMIGLGLLQRLSPRMIGMLGALIVLLHNLLDPIHAAGLGRFANLWMILHQRGFLLYHGRPLVNLSFPILSWFGVMCLGYAFGSVLTLPYSKRRRVVLGLSGVFLLSFALLRILRGYGDTNRFAQMRTVSRTVMSFLQVQKFPPSLHYILATVGILLLLYAAFDYGVEEDWLPRLRGFLEVYGRVPFLFYVLHIFLLHAVTLAVSFATRGDWRCWIGPGKFWGERVRRIGDTVYRSSIPYGSLSCWRSTSLAVGSVISKLVDAIGGSVTYKLSRGLLFQTRRNRNG